MSFGAELHTTTVYTLPCCSVLVLAPLSGRYRLAVTGYSIFYNAGQWEHRQDLRSVVEIQKRL